MRTRFGMLMTDAVGKAGGQCIQRRGNTRVLRNISIPTQRQASTQNKQRFTANYLFSVWATLSQSIRDEWALVATTLRGTDTFGNEKSFTAREAFLKCNGVLYNYTKTLIDPFTFDYTVPTLDMESITLDISDTELKLDVNSITNAVCVQMKSIALRNAATNPTVEKLKTFNMSSDYLEADTNFVAFLKMNNSVIAGNLYSIAVRAVSSSGLVSPWFQVQVLAVP